MKWATKESVSLTPAWEKLLQKCPKRGILKCFLWDIGATIIIVKVMSWDKTHCNKFSLLKGLIMLGDFSTLMDRGREGTSGKSVCDLVHMQRLFPHGYTWRQLCAPTHLAAHSSRFIPTFRNANPHGHGDGFMSASRQIFSSQHFSVDGWVS